MRAFVRGGAVRAPFPSPPSRSTEGDGRRVKGETAIALDSSVFTLT